MLAMKQSPVQESYRQSYGQSTPNISVSVRPRRFWQRASAISCILACTAVFWSIANTGAKIDNMNYSINKIQTQIQTASAENASLTVQVDKLQQPERILGIAIGQLHMHIATPVHIQAASIQANH